jgi:hypothetical protein
LQGQFATQRHSKALDKLAVCSQISPALILQTNQIAVRNRFNVEEIPFEAKPIREQKALFYAKAVPFKILSITAPTAAS